MKFFVVNRLRSDGRTRYQYNERGLATRMIFSPDFIHN